MAPIGSQPPKVNLPIQASGRTKPLMHYVSSFLNINRQRQLGREVIHEPRS